jgi:hypothetical protein
VRRAWWIGLLVLAACGGIAEALPDGGSPGDDAATHGPSPGVDSGGGDATLDAASHDAPAEAGLPDATAQQDASDAGPPCPPGTHPCGASCVDLLNDPLNCGSCGDLCSTCEQCTSGTCSSSCGPNMVLCGPPCFCTNPLTDNSNCGSCGNACPPGELCLSGSCGCECPPGELSCGQPCTCVDPSANDTHCGATPGCGDLGFGSPGTVCEAGTTCVAGRCMGDCRPTTVLCVGQCIDPNTDPEFCGATGFCGDPTGYPGTLCQPGTTCVGGSCTPLDAAAD